MPPKKIIWPATLAEYKALEEKAKQKYLPLLRNLQLFELTGLNEALGAALEELEAAARVEDLRRGIRPPGTRIGR